MDEAWRNDRSRPLYGRSKNKSPNSALDGMMASRSRDAYSTANAYTNAIRHGFIKAPKRRYRTV